jgi:lipoprotein-anchoring transpeptidase ErfK/SrfK
MLALATLFGLLWFTFPGRTDHGGVAADVGAALLPASPTPALRIGRPKPLLPPRFLSRWTVVLRPTTARAQADRGAAIVARLAEETPEGTANLVTVLGAKTDAAGQLWVKVRLPMLPNGTVGWVPRRALGAYESVRTYLVIDRARLRATLYRNGKLIFSAPVGVGAAAWPTPRGIFTVRSKLTRYRSPFYGPLAFGTTARSAVLTDWPAGGFVGLHGTNEPQLIPGRVSHGCIRMRNQDIIHLARLMPVGTPLTIL